MSEQLINLTAQEFHLTSVGIQIILIATITLTIVTCVFYLIKIIFFYNSRAATVFELTGLHNVYRERFVVIRPQKHFEQIVAIVEIVGKDYSQQSSGHEQLIAERNELIKNLFDKKSRSLGHKINIISLRLGQIQEEEKQLKIEGYPIAEQLRQKWQQHINKSSSLVTRNFMVVECQPHPISDNNKRERILNDLTDMLTDASRLFEENCNLCQVVSERLRQDIRQQIATQQLNPDSANAKISEISIEQYYSALLNPAWGRWDSKFKKAIQPTSIHALPLSTWIPETEVFFEKDRSILAEKDKTDRKLLGNLLDKTKIIWRKLMLESNTRSVMYFSSWGRKQYCVGLRVTGWGDNISEIMLNVLLSSDYQIYINQHLIKRSSDALKSSITMGIDSRISSVLGSEMAELRSDALSALRRAINSDDIAFDYEVSLLVFGDSALKARENALTVRQKLLNLHQVTAIEENQQSFITWQQFYPGNKYTTSAYKVIRTSAAIAEILAFHRKPRGWFSSDFGNEPVVELPEPTGGNLYAFNFHVSPQPFASGHTLMFGGTGSGKTTLMLFLISQLLKFENVKIICLDSLSGMRTFSDAIGGRYVNTGSGFKLNPLAMDLSVTSNREHIEQLFSRWLTYQHGYKDTDSYLIDEEKGQITNFTEALIKSQIHQELNMLSLSQAPPNQMLASLFGTDGYLGRWWGQQDSFTFNQPLTIIDVEQIINSETARITILPYLLHKIEREVAGDNNQANKVQKTFIFVDEARPLTEEPLLASFLQKYIEQGRKRGVVMALAFQQLASITQNQNQRFADSMISNCPTQIIFPNTVNKKEELAKFSLTEKEMEFVQGKIYSPGSRSVLVRHTGTDSKIVNVDLSPLGNLVRIFASNSNMATKYQAEFGKKDWLQHFLQEAS